MMKCVIAASLVCAVLAVPTSPASERGLLRGKRNGKKRGQRKNKNKNNNGKNKQAQRLQDILDAGEAQKPVFVSPPDYSVAPPSTEPVVEYDFLGSLVEGSSVIYEGQVFEVLSKNADDTFNLVSVVVEEGVGKGETEAVLEVLNVGGAELSPVAEDRAFFFADPLMDMLMLQKLAPDKDEEGDDDNGKSSLLPMLMMSGMNGGGGNQMAQTMMMMSMMDDDDSSMLPFLMMAQAGNGQQQGMFGGNQNNNNGFNTGGFNKNGGFNSGNNNNGFSNNPMASMLMLDGVSDGDIDPMTAVAIDRMDEGGINPLMLLMADGGMDKDMLMMMMMMSGGFNQQQNNNQQPSRPPYYNNQQPRYNNQQPPYYNQPPNFNQPNGRAPYYYNEPNYNQPNGQAPYYYNEPNFRSENFDVKGSEVDLGPDEGLPMP